MKLAHIPLALGFVLFGAANFVLEPAHNCAVDRDSCEMAVAAAQRWPWLFPDLAGKQLSCVPSPDCFTARSECIEGYRGARAEGFCR